MSRTLLSFLLLSASVLMADVTGTWRGTLTPPDGNESPALVILKQSDTAVSGSVGPHETERFEFDKGKAEGNTITFEVTAGSRVMKFKLTMDGDKLTGQISRERDGEVQTAKLDLKREK